MDLKTKTITTAGAPVSMGHVEEGKRFLSAGEYGAAEKQFRQALRADKNNASAHFELGKTYYMTRRYHKAEPALHTFLRSEPRNRHALYLLGKINRFNGRHAAAVGFFKKALALGEKHAELFREQGMAYAAQKNFAFAARSFTTALAYKKTGDGYLALADALKEGGRNREALAAYRRAYRYVGSRARAYAEAGKLLAAQKSWRQARAALETAVRLGNADPDVRWRLLTVSRQLNQKREKKYLENKRLNEHEAKVSKTKLASQPVSLSVVLTTRCNLRCVMCSTYQNKWDFPAEKLPMLAAYFPYLQTVNWQGGEVFLYKNFEPLFDQAARYTQLQQIITTNGLLLNERWIHKLVANNVKLVVSIDDITQKAYERIRRGARFEKLLENLHRIAQARTHHAARALSRFTLALQAVVMKSNYRKLPRFAAFARKHGFDELQLIPEYSATNKETLFTRLTPGLKKELTGMIDALRARCLQYNCVFHNTIALTEAGPSRGSDIRAHGVHVIPGGSEKKELANGFPACRLPWQSLFINDGGKVYPYCYCEKEVGSIEKDSIASLWNNAGMQAYRRAMAQQSYRLCGRQCTARLIDKQYLSK